MSYVGIGMFGLGCVGVLAFSKGRRGFWNWTRTERWGALASAVLLIAGLVVMDNTAGG